MRSCLEIARNLPADGSAAVLDVDSADRHPYLLTLKVVDCVSGE